MAKAQETAPTTDDFLEVAFEDMQQKIRYFQEREQDHIFLDEQDVVMRRSRMAIADIMHKLELAKAYYGPNHSKSHELQECIDELIELRSVVDGHGICFGQVQIATIESQETKGMVRQVCSWLMQEDAGQIDPNPQDQTPPPELSEQERAFINFLRLIYQGQRAYIAMRNQEYFDEIGITPDIRNVQGYSAAPYVIEEAKGVADMTVSFIPPGAAKPVVRGVILDNTKRSVDGHPVRDIVKNRIVFRRILHRMYGGGISLGAMFMRQEGHQVGILPDNEHTTLDERRFTLFDPNCKKQIANLTIDDIFSLCIYIDRDILQVDGHRQYFDNLEELIHGIAPEDVREIVQSLSFESFLQESDESRALVFDAMKKVHPWMQKVFGDVCPSVLSCKFPLEVFDWGGSKKHVVHNDIGSIIEKTKAQVIWCNMGDKEYHFVCDTGRGTLQPLECDFYINLIAKLDWVVPVQEGQRGYQNDEEMYCIGGVRHTLATLVNRPLTYDQFMQALTVMEDGRKKKSFVITCGKLKTIQPKKSVGKTHQTKHFAALKEQRRGPDKDAQTGSTKSSLSHAQNKRI